MKIECTKDQANELITAVLSASYAAEAEARTNDKTVASLKNIPGSEELVTNFKNHAEHNRAQAERFRQLVKIVAIAVHQSE